MLHCVKQKSGVLEIERVCSKDNHVTLFSIEGTLNQKPFRVLTTRGSEAGIQKAIDTAGERGPLKRVSVFNSWHAADVLSERVARGMEPTHTAYEVSVLLKNHR